MRPVLFLLLLCVSADAVADQAAEREATIKEQELEEVRERIGEIKAALDRNAEERDQVTKDLQSAEVRIAETRKRLTDIERERDYSERRRNELQADISVEEKRLDTEMGKLGDQVRAAWMNGGQERLKLLLNQQDPATLGRLLVYYDYLNNHRAENIRSVNSIIERLTGLRNEAATEASRLAAIAERRSRELTELDVAQQERRGLLETLNARMQNQSREIERLQAEERDLTRLIDELTEILSDYPIRAQEPFATYRGKLTWPVAGNLQHDFGQPRVGGQLKWNGVVLMAPKGREVRAVYHGRVVFADWLAGLGLLLVIDHGDNYMTLYGYNETLLKDSGDWVAPGDVIATVGDSGGQAQPALYFEVRRGTTPLDPGDWVTRSPSGTN